jgi:long-chain fatty acid transport protein
LRPSREFPVGHSRGSVLALALIALQTVPFWNSATHAAGFTLREYSLTGASTSFAGASAGDESPAYLAFNPAAAAGVIGEDAQVTLNVIAPSSDATFGLATTSAGTAAGGSMQPQGFIQDALEPGASWRLRLTENLAAGISVSAPWGLATEYDRTWAGRYYAVESRLLALNIAPDLAWQVTDTLTVGVGLQVQYAKGLLSNAIDFGVIGAAFSVPGSLPGQQDGFAEFKASDWAIGYRAGLIYKPDPSLSLGLAWRSGIRHELKGDVDFTLDGAGTGSVLAGATGAFVDTAARTRLSLPYVASAGVAWRATDKLTLLGEVSYTDWSTIKELRVQYANPAQPDTTQRYDWSGAWLYALGARYDIDPEWTLRAGAAIDGTPTRDATRDPRIPDATRTWLSASIEHHITPSVSVQLGYAKLMFPEEPINLSSATPGNEVRGNLQGTTDADADMISIQISFR